QISYGSGCLAEESAQIWKTAHQSAGDSGKSAAKQSERSERGLGSKTSKRLEPLFQSINCPAGNIADTFRYTSDRITATSGYITYGAANCICCAATCISNTAHRLYSS